MKKATDRIIRRIWDFENQLRRSEVQEIKDRITIKHEKCTELNQFDYFKALRERCINPELEDKLIAAYEYFKTNNEYALYNEIFNMHYDDLLDFAYANQYQDFYNYIINDYNETFKNIKNHITTGRNFWTNDFQLICHFNRQKSDMAKETVEDYLDELIRIGKIYGYKCVIDSEDTLEFYIEEDNIAF